MRIFIDCSLVDFHIIPTGIPRVVSNYVVHGRGWGARRNSEVIAVVPRADGLFAIGALPASPASEKSRAAGRVRGLYAAGRRLRNLMRRGLYGLDRVLPLRAGSTVFYHLDARISTLATAIVQGVRRLDERKRPIEPQPGDILFCPGLWHEVDPELYRKLAGAGCQIVPLIHDVLPITHPHFYPSLWRDVFRDRMLATFDYASVFVCVSETTRRSLAAFAAANGRNGRFDVARNGYQPLSAAAGSLTTARRDLNRLFADSQKPLLMVGSIEPKKNYIRVVECLEEKWRRGYPRSLLIVGRPGWMSDEIIRRIRHSPQFDRKLFWLNDLEDAALGYAYAGCHALIFASLAEGFGLPMIEASMQRKPPLVYRSDIATEILGDYGVFFDDTPASLPDAIDALEQPETYRRCCARLQTFVWPAWQDCCDLLFDQLAAGSGLPDRAAKQALL